jgi:hypothetical protein
MCPTPAVSSEFKDLLTHAAERAAQSGLFGALEFVPPPALALRCQAKASADPAFYSLFLDAGTLYVALQTPARYLSQSIEADLVFTGDKLEELLHEEMIELGYAGAPLSMQHFRSEDLLYTFRSPLAVTPEQWATHATRELVAQALLAYEATFRPLGDMEGDDDED